MSNTAAADGITHAPWCAACEAAHAPGSGPVCAELIPAGEQVRAALPPELASSGCVLAELAGQALPTLVLAGSWRTELLILDGGRVGVWVTAAPSPPALLRLALAAQRAYALDGDCHVGIGALREPGAPGWPSGAAGAASPPPGVWRLSCDETIEVRWLVSDGEAVLGGSPEPPELEPGPFDPELAAQVVDAFGWAAQPVPDPAPAAMARGLAVLRQRLVAAFGAPRSGGVLAIDPRVRSAALWAGADALTSVRFDGRDSSVERAPWAPLGPASGWTKPAWVPPAALGGCATVGAAQALLVHLADGYALALREGPADGDASTEGDGAAGGHGGAGANGEPPLRWFKLGAD
ncbi:MAG: hypothetical protein ACKVWR_12765 [Acidimicrobiales bacterium]